ncbi:MAG: dipicolinate synthase subunit B [Clostridiales bacterium]|nr:dipicolinate synthase subunit B [Clostridiales bacterium]
MKNSKLTIGFAITGSFCTFRLVFEEIEKIANEEIIIFPIMSEKSYEIDTRFGKASRFVEKFENITKKEVIHSLEEVEPIGPKRLFDVLIIAPCTGNTLAKIANGISDSCVTLAAKAHLRNNRPIVIAISTNDGLGTNAQNIGKLLNRKNIFFVPFKQDDPNLKENSLVAKMEMILPTIRKALVGKQIQPILLLN